MTPELTENARRVLEARYLLRDVRGSIVETPEQLLRRVAREVAAAEARFGKGEPERREEDFFEAMASLEFLPSSPTLMNAGTRLGQLCACYVLPVEDSLEEIFESLKLMARIQQSGGGTGFAFSHLRPRGARVLSAGGTASGPVSFMRIFDCATENIRQGGKRQGANMGVLRVDHPDILEFIDAKRDGASFRNFNLSIAVTDEFMRAAQEAGTLTLRDPRSGESAGALRAAEVFSRIAQAAWEKGDPGILFLDALARGNPLPEQGVLEATNPCGEVPLLPYEACSLASINLGRMLRDRGTGEGLGIELDSGKLARTVRLAVRFLDDVIEVNRWPSAEIARATTANRKIGLGVMGFADALLRLEIPYASDRAIAFAEQVSALIAREAQASSEELARERGEFPSWGRSVFAPGGPRLRNATRTSIAPTGSLSIIAGTSASIEPLFALAYRRENVLGGQTLAELNPLLGRYAERHGLDRLRIESHVASAGSLEGAPDVPQAMRDLFRTALEISPDDHLRVQQAFQRNVDNAVSKTVNLPRAVSAGEVEAVYLKAWQLGLKGVTIYRYGSKREQVLRLGAEEPPEAAEHFARCDPLACKL